MVSRSRLKLITVIIIFVSRSETCLRSIYLGKHIIIIGTVLNTVKYIEFVLRSDHHPVGHPKPFHVFQGTYGHIPRILVKGSVIRKIDHPHITDHRQSRYFGITVYNGRFKNRYEDHVTVLHRSISVIGSVKTDSVFHGTLRQPFSRNTQVTPSSVNIRKLKVHHPDPYILDQLLNIL